MDLTTVFVYKVIELREALIALHHPQIKNNKSALKEAQAHYEQMKKEAQSFLDQHPELESHPLACRVPRG